MVKGDKNMDNTQEHLNALLEGKMLAFNDTEYSTFVVLE